MKKDKLKIVLLVKEFLFDLDSILCRFPNKEKVLRDKIRTVLYELIELIYIANYMPLDKYRDDRIKLQIKILSKLSLIDLLLEESYRKGYITESMFLNKAENLSLVSTKVKGWILYEKNNNKRDD